MATTTSKATNRRAILRRLPLSEIIIFAVIAGVVVAGIVLGIVAGAAPTGIATNLGFYASVAIVFAILALGFNLQWGYTGLFNAGIAGFYLIGAYTAAIAITPLSPPIIVGGVVVLPGHLGGYSLPLPVGVFLAMYVSGLTAMLIALPVLRLRADYLAIATLAFAEILQIVTTNLQSVTGGSIGLPSIPKPIVYITPDAPFLNAITIVAIGSVVLVFLLVILQVMVESPWGRVLRAIREDEEATMALGKPTFDYKLQAFALGGALMGLAGALYAVTFGYISPSTFAPSVTFSVWVMVIVGGSGNNRGALVGAFLIYGIEWLSVLLKDFAPQNVVPLPSGLQQYAGVIALVVAATVLEGLVYIAAGWGLLKLRLWAWWVLMVASILSIVSQLVQYAIVPGYGFPYLVLVPAFVLVYLVGVRNAFPRARTASKWSSETPVPSDRSALPDSIESRPPHRRTGVTILGAFSIFAGSATVILGLWVLFVLGFIVKDTIFYVRLMVIGVLLIVLIIYRPEGILREKKRVLR